MINAQYPGGVIPSVSDSMVTIRILKFLKDTTTPSTVSTMCTNCFCQKFSDTTPCFQAKWTRSNIFFSRFRFNQTFLAFRDVLNTYILSDVICVNMTIELCDFNYLKGLAFFNFLPDFENPIKPVTPEQFAHIFCVQEKRKELVRGV